MGTVNRPGFFKFGGLVLGVGCGLQFSLWRMRSIYQKVDPDGSTRLELENLFKVTRNKAATTADGTTITNGTSTVVGTTTTTTTNDWHSHPNPNPNLLPPTFQLNNNHPHHPSSPTTNHYGEKFD